MFPARHVRLLTPLSVGDPAKHQGGGSAMGFSEVFRMGWGVNCEIVLEK